jgi:GABA permease
MASRAVDTPSQETPPQAPADTVVHRGLVVANETVGGRELIQEIERRTRGRRAEVRVVAPALIESRVRHALGDVDDAREKAQERLEQSVAEIRRFGVEATGDVGDADPSLAIEDALRTFPADEVIISTHPPESSTWLEKDLVERARRELSVPITHVVVDMEAERDQDKVKLIERFQPRRRRRRGDDEQLDYLPPLSTRDRLTLLVGIPGTIVLGILALTCPDDGSFTGGCAVRGGIAISAFGIPPAILLSLLVE